MNIEILKDKLIAANNSYRAGTPVMEDGEFDSLLDELQKQMPADSFSMFKDSLHEVKGKVKHPYVLGSLDKLKAEEPENVKKFIAKNIKTAMNVSAKVDGISCRLHYKDGKLVSASTRGNGTFGEDLTDKIQHVNNIMMSIPEKEVLDIRGELVIFKDAFFELHSEFANPRNAVAGFMNRKDWNESDIKTVTFVPYTVLGPKLSKSEQFDFIEKLGFKTAWHINIDKKDAMSDDVVETLTQYAEQQFDYETDGLVICDCSYHNEERYRPEACVAFKINQQIAETTLLDVVFDGPSKDGTHSPVAVLEPVDLGGAMISRASVYNLDAIDNLGLVYGCKVKLLRSGDVIPKIVNVISRPANAKPIVLPKTCNCCGTPLVRDGVNLRCMNYDCKDQKLWQITYFIKKLGVKSVSDRTLANLDIFSIKDLLAFKPNLKSKTQTKLADELKLKVFSRSKKELLGAMNFCGLGETSIYKIVDFYGWENILSGTYNGLPDGIGDTLLERFTSKIAENLSDLDMLTKDIRYHYDDVMLSKASAKSNGMSVCFTGKLETMGRKEAEAKATDAGFAVKNVSKGLTYLVTNDPSTNSGKGKKARELGINIISEKEFLKMISSETVEQDIGDL